MSAQSMIDQLLRSGLGAMRGTGMGTGSSGGGLSGALGGLAGKGGLGSLGGLLQGNAGKYAAGGVLGMLLGSRGGRSMGGSALKYGSVAALGALAWHTYNQWQARQGQSGGAMAAKPVPAFESLPAPQIEMHSRAMLKAIIAAAKSDGHLDDREREAVEAELVRSEADPALRAWVEAELRVPVEPADVAAAASTPEMAAEIYLASLAVVDQTTTMERAYLDELARQLKLPDSLKAELEARAAAA